MIVINCFNLFIDNRPLCFLSQQPPHLKVTMALSPIEILDYPPYPSPNQDHMNVLENENEPESEVPKDFENNDSQEDNNESENENNELEQENIENVDQQHDAIMNDQVDDSNINNDKISPHEIEKDLNQDEDVVIIEDKDIDFGMDENIQNDNLTPISVISKEKQMTQNESSYSQKCSSQIAYTHSLSKSKDKISQAELSKFSLASQTKPSQASISKSNSQANKGFSSSLKNRPSTQNFVSLSINMTKNSKASQNAQSHSAMNKTSQESSFGEELTIEDEDLLEDDGDEILVGATDDELEDSQD